MDKLTKKYIKFLYNSWKITNNAINKLKTIDKYNLVGYN